MKAIVAMAENGIIGRDGSIPWHEPEDLKFFKRTTLGHAVVMGRKTFESIGRPLPGRENYVVTSTRSYQDQIVRVVKSLEEVPRSLPDGREVFVIGGAALYEALLPECSELYLTLVAGNPEGDTWFPPFEHIFSDFEVMDRLPGLEFRRYWRTR